MKILVLNGSPRLQDMRIFSAYGRQKQLRIWDSLSAYMYAGVSWDDGAMGI